MQIKIKDNIILPKSISGNIVCGYSNNIKKRKPVVDMECCPYNSCDTCYPEMCKFSINKMEANTDNNIPQSIYDFLEYFAQSYGEISYNDISKIKNKDIGLIKDAIEDIKSGLDNYAGDIYELSMEDSSFDVLCKNLVDLIKDE